MPDSGKPPEEKVLSRARYMLMRGTRALTLNCPDDGDGCALEPGERAVIQVSDLGDGLLCTKPFAARGDKLVRRIAPIEVPPLPWPCTASARSDEAKAHAQGGVNLRRLRAREREALAAEPDPSPPMRTALTDEAAARRGSRFWRIVVETRCVGPGETRRTLWSIPPGTLSAVVHPRNQEFQRMRRNGQVPDDWRRI